MSQIDLSIKDQNLTIPNLFFVNYKDVNSREKVLIPDNLPPVFPLIKSSSAHKDKLCSLLLFFFLYVSYVRYTK